MDTDESFSELSQDASVTESTEGADSEDNELTDIDSGEDSYMDSGKETSEDVISDADIDIYLEGIDCADKQTIMNELNILGWKPNEIEQWSEWQDNLTDAMSKMSIGENMAGGVFDLAPYIRMMYDGGTFNLNI